MRTPTTIAALLLLSAGALSAGDWEQFRASAPGAGSTDELIEPIAGPSVLEKKWEVQFPSSEARSSPIVVGARVYVGSEDGALRCLDAASGALLWSFQTGGAIRSTPAYFKGRLVFGSLDRNLYVLHAGTGEVLWSLNHGGVQIGSPLVATIPGPVDAIFFGVGDPTNEIRAYGLVDGNFLWQQDTGQPVTSKPAFYSGATPSVIVGNNVGHWQAYNAVTGAPIWSEPFEAPNGWLYTSAAVDGEKVIFCSGGGDRFVHVLDAVTGIEQKKVLAVPPGYGKVGGSVGGDVTPFHPGAYLDPEVLEGLLNILDKAPRDEEVDAWAGQLGFDAGKMKEWFDEQIASGAPSINELYTPGGVYWVNLNRGVLSSSVSISGNLAYVTHRELSGRNKDEYFTVAIDFTDAVAEDDSVIWGTTPLTETWMNGRIMPSPAVSAGTYVYYAHTSNLHIADAADGTLQGTKDVGDYILGGPTLANGGILVTTLGGKLICYAGANSPPTAPTTFNPFDGENITGVSTPTVFWSGHADAQSAAGTLQSHLEFDFGWANSDLETSLSKARITLPAGTTSYMFAPVPDNTHIFYRVRVEDEQGARSGWSGIQDFWVNRDLDPPLPPENVVAVAGNASIGMMWDPSPSSDVEKQRLRFKESGQTWAQATLIDNIAPTTTEYQLNGLTNGTTYDLSLSAVDFGENESTAVIVSATPNPPITIGGTGPGFPTIQGALDAAVAGQTVVLQAGYFVERVFVPPGVSLRGISPSMTILDGSGSGVVITVHGTFGIDLQTQVSHMRVTNGGVGIDAGEADVWIHHVVLTGLTSHAVVGEREGRLNVENCTIVGNVGTGVWGSSHLTSVLSSIIAFNGGYGVRLPGAAGVAYSDLYSNFLGDLAEPLNEIDNIRIQPFFVDDQFHIQDASQTVDAGDPAADFDNEPMPNGGRINQGAYGNTSEAALSTAVGGAPGGGGGGAGGGAGGTGGGGSGPTGLLSCGVESVAAAAPSGRSTLALLLLLLLMIGIATRRTVRV